jgi:hypothetical protein
MTTPDAFRDAEYFADVSGIPDPGDVADHDHDHGPDHAATPARQDLRQAVQKKAKTALIDRLLRELDIVLYCQLAALYYMEYVFDEFPVLALNMKLVTD